MKRKPWALVILAILHLFAPIGNIFINSQLMKISPLTYFQALFLKENLVHAFIFLVIPVLLSASIYACRNWSYKAYISLMMVPFVYSFISWLETPSITTGFVLAVFYAFNISLVSYFLLPAIRQIYFDPRLRWWETKPRYAVDIKCEIKFEDKKIIGQIKNFSVGGLYLESTEQIPNDAALDISFEYATELYSIHGNPVFFKASPPAGYGVKFITELGADRKIAGLIEKLKVSSPIVNARNLGEEDSLKFWLKTAFKTKSAWVPEVKSTHNQSKAS